MSFVIGIGQPGETIDTLAEVRYAKDRGSNVIDVSNMVDSALAWESDAVLCTRDGLEIGVAFLYIEKPRPAKSLQHQVTADERNRRGLIKFRS